MTTSNEIDDVLEVVRERIRTGSGASEIRNLFYRPLLREGRFDTADLVMDELLSHYKDNLMLIRDATSAFLRKGDHKKASNTIRKGFEITSEPGEDFVAHAIQTFLASNEVTDAAALSAKTEALWENNQRLCHMALLALHRGGSDYSAISLRAAKQLLQLNTSDLVSISLAANILSSAGEVQASLAGLIAARAETSDNKEALFETARAMHLLHEDPPEVEALLHKVLNMDPNHVRAKDLLAKCNLANGQNSRALALLIDIPEKQRSDSINRHLASALQEAGQYDRAVGILRKLLDKNPDNQPLRRQLTNVLSRDGQFEAAHEVYSSGIARRRDALEGSLSSNFSKVRSGQVRTSIPQHRLDWAYSILEKYGTAPEDRQAWERASACNARLEQLLVDWIECHPNRFDELHDFLDMSETARSSLDSLIAKQKGVLVASAHVGVLFAGPILLQANGYPMTWLASTPKLGVGGIDDNLISTTTDSDKIITASILKSLTANKVVSIAIDGSASTQRTKHRFFDKSIGLSEFVPRLAYRRGAPSVFPSLVWRNGKVHADLEQLPDPQAGEDIEVFTARWMASFVDRLERFFCSEQENLRFVGGFWSKLTI